MNLTRREAFSTLGAAGLVLLGGCRTQPRNVKTYPNDLDARLLNRFGFGPTVADLEHVRRIGRDKWVEEQLQAPAHEPWIIEQKFFSLPIVQLSAWELRDWPEDDILRQLQLMAFWRANSSPWQLRERTVHFWFDHFNIFARKGLAAYRKPSDEREVVRSNALGLFPSMLKQSAHSTAMLLFLDQQASNKFQPNENYGRELLELHSLGVNGGYTQKDVMEVARCFTGWTEERGAFAQQGTFKFEPGLHDDGEKTVLGHKIPAGGGILDGEQVIDIVSRHPSTARHISQKLAQVYVGKPSEKLISEMTRTYERTNGNIKDLILDVYRSDEWALPDLIMKRPFDLIVSALRSTGTTTDGDIGIQEALKKMGQPLFQWPMPDGYPTDSQSWSSSVLARWEFAFNFSKGKIKGTQKPSPENLATEQIFLGTANEEAVKRVSRVRNELSDPDEQLALVICSPEFQ